MNCSVSQIRHYAMRSIKGLIWCFTHLHAREGMGNTGI